MNDAERLAKLIEVVDAALVGARESGWSSELERDLRRALSEARSRK